MIKQRTLKKPIMIEGIGIHTGQTIHLTIHPAPGNTGIIFQRVDLQPPVAIPATHSHVGDTRLNTCLANGNVTISTVEHLLSALAGLGIDNAYIDIAAPELPALDGSSLPFVRLIQEAGVTMQEADKLFLKIKQKVVVTEGDKQVSIEPYDGFKFILAIDFTHPSIRASQQQLSIDFAKASYITEISQARTFGFLAEYDYLRNNNLALGASLDNTVVLDDSKIVNVDGLRDPDEFIKHKMLDAIGDLFLLGHQFIGAFSGHKSGHNLNHQLRQAVLADKNTWELVTRRENEGLPVSFQLV